MQINLRDVFLVLVVLVSQSRSSGTRACYISGWKVIRCNWYGARLLNKPQSTNAYNRPFLKLLPTSTTNTNGLSSICLGTSTVDNYGFSISGWRSGSDGTPALRIKAHNNSASGTDVMTMLNSGNVGMGS